MDFLYDNFNTELRDLDFGDNYSSKLLLKQSFFGYKYYKLKDFYYIMRYMCNDLMNFGSVESNYNKTIVIKFILKKDNLNEFKLKELKNIESLINKNDYHKALVNIYIQLALLKSKAEESDCISIDFEFSNENIDNLNSIMCINIDNNNGEAIIKVKNIFQTYFFVGNKPYHDLREYEILRFMHTLLTREKWQIENKENRELIIILSSLQSEELKNFRGNLFYKYDIKTNSYDFYLKIDPIFKLIKSYSKIINAINNLDYRNNL